MHEVEVKLSAMHLGGKKRVLVLGDIEGRLTRNLCECILYFYGEICSIPENVPRFLKNGPQLASLRAKDSRDQI